MKTGVIVMNFGEPENATPEEVVPFLERIFSQNSSLESTSGREAAMARAHDLAERRAPALIEEYQAIGGSPLNAQARWQAEALEEELRGRGHDVHCYVGMQFLEPFIADAVARAREDGMERLVGLPVYPLCGRSTTVASLQDLREAVGRLEWEVDVVEISGWHRHPDYVPFHADHIRDFLGREGVDLGDPGTRLLCSAHGTPVKYLKNGPRYDLYVDEFCDALGEALGVPRYELGFQNHTNRPLEWTQPDVDDVVAHLKGERVVVVGVSFMHEQSETLSELDEELREVAEGAGLDFHRVPIPHDSPRFISILSDLVAGALGEEADVASASGLVPCLCRETPSTFCTNGGDHSGGG